MGSKGRFPPPHLRHPLPGPGMMQHDTFGPMIRPPPGGFHPLDMLPHPEVLEQKLASQHMEMQKLARENQRLAATHGTLRQELAAAQNELQMLHSHLGVLKTDSEQQARGLSDKIANMDAELQAAEPLKLELQQARAEAQSLFTERQELVSKLQHLTQDLQRAHADRQQIPPLLSELESLRQEYQRCRDTYEYEKKLYKSHLESLQVMEQNYITMKRDLEKLRADFANKPNFDKQPAGPYGGSSGYSENSTGNHAAVHNTYSDGHGNAQGQSPLAGGDAATKGGSGGGGSTVAGAVPRIGAQPGPAPVRAAYDASKGESYNSQKGPGAPVIDSHRGPNDAGYEAHRGPSRASYDAQRGVSASSYEAQRGPNVHGYEAQRRPAYDAQGGPSYESQQGSHYDGHRAPVYHGQRGSEYDAQRTAGPRDTTDTAHNATSRSNVGHQGQPTSGYIAPPYGSATPPASSVTQYDVSRVGNPVRR